MYMQLFSMDAFDQKQKVSNYIISVASHSEAQNKVPSVLGLRQRFVKAILPQ